MEEADALLSKIRDFLEEDISRLYCYASVYTLPDDEWGYLMFLRDEIDSFFKKKAKNNV